MALTEIAERTFRIESLIGPRNLFQYLLVGDKQALLVDTGTSESPRDAILPAIRAVGVSPEALRFVVVTHPDLDHQGGLAGLREVLPAALACCGFEDRPLVSDPERLVADRYGAYEREHLVGYSDREKAEMGSLAGAPAVIDLGFSGGERLELGGRTVDVLHAPGHSAGHLLLHEPATGLLFSSDAVHWRMCPAADGRPALPPTYEDVDAYLGTIEVVASLAARELHSGHWPMRTGREVNEFLTESRLFVEAMDAALEDRLLRPASLRELCEHADSTLGPFGADPVNLAFVVHGHVRRGVRRGRIALLDPTERPVRFERVGA